jgi:hypothetical protein
MIILPVIPSEAKSRLQRSPEWFRGEARLSIPMRNTRYLRGIPSAPLRSAQVNQ